MKISGLVTVKMLDKKAQSTLMLKLKFVRNTGSLNVIVLWKWKYLI